MSRKCAREDSFRIIFQSLTNKLCKEEYLDNYFETVNLPSWDEEEFYINKPTDADNEYIKRTVEGVLEKQEELDKIISENLVGWDVKRISKVSIAAMRLALFEMLYSDDIPVNVAINEAIEIAKKYDGAECGSFINGALGSAAGKLIK